MNKNDITLDLNKLRLCEKSELKEWLNKNSNFKDWSFKMLDKYICHYLDYESSDRWKITDKIRPSKKEITYNEFKQFIQ